jgi:SsrA-binding protein
MKKTSNQFASNQPASQKYRRLECYEAGIKLLGSEVKAVKAGLAAITGAYVVVRGGEAYAINVTIPQWQSNNPSSAHEPERPKKLLLSKKQLRKLEDYDQKKGFALVVYSLYNKNGLIKVDLCVSVNKTTRDKRQEIKRRDQARDIRRQTKYNL